VTANGAGSRKKQRKRSRNQYPAAKRERCARQVSDAIISRLDRLDIPRAYTRIHVHIWRERAQPLQCSRNAIKSSRLAKSIEGHPPLHSRTESAASRRAARPAESVVAIISLVLFYRARTTIGSLRPCCALSPSHPPPRPVWASQLSLFEHLVPQRGWQDESERERERERERRKEGPSSLARGGPAL
jgi:hypothetical protein